MMGYGGLVQADDKVRERPVAFNGVGYPDDGRAALGFFLNSPMEHR